MYTAACRCERPGYVICDHVRVCMTTSTPEKSTFARTCLTKPCMQTHLPFACRGANTNTHTVHVTHTYARATHTIRHAVRAKAAALVCTRRQACALRIQLILLPSVMQRGLCLDYGILNLWIIQSNRILPPPPTAAKSLD